MAKVAIINDTHFGVRQDSVVYANSQKLFYENVFFPTIDSNNVKHVLHLGDVFDRRKYANFLTIRNANEMFFDRIVERNIETHVIVGNHDTFYRDTNEINSMRLLYSQSKYDNLHIYWEKPVIVTIDNLDIMMCPWICSENQKQSLEAISNTNAKVLMGHFEIMGFEMLKGTLCDHGLEQNLFSKFHCVFSGHFHHPSSYQNITYLGAPYEMNWGDYQGRRGFHLFDTETLELEFIENPYSVHHRFLYDDTNMTYEDLLDIDYSVFNEVYLKIVISNKTKNDIYEAFMDKVLESGVASVTVIEEDLGVDFSEEETINEVEDTFTIITNYIEKVKTKGSKDELKKKAFSIYNEALNL